MPELLLSVIRFIRLLLSGHQAIAIENAALRRQLVAFQRKRKRPVLTTFDRVSGKAMARTGLRMMPTFPLPPLKFRTVSFPSTASRPELQTRPSQRTGLPSSFVLSAATAAPG